MSLLDSCNAQTSSPRIRSGSSTWFYQPGLETIPLTGSNLGREICGVDGKDGWIGFMCILDGAAWSSALSASRRACHLNLGCDLFSLCFFVLLHIHAFPHYHRSSEITKYRPAKCLMVWSRMNELNMVVVQVFHWTDRAPPCSFLNFVDQSTNMRPSDSRRAKVVSNAQIPSQGLGCASSLLNSWLSIRLGTWMKYFTSSNLEIWGRWQRWINWTSVDSGGTYG